jgi:hypothetical protein
MSKIALASNVDGTGTFTIASPDSNTDRTLTLPDNSGTLMSTASAITTAQLPVGSVLQVVYGSTTTQTVSTITTYADTTLTATITPTSATSEILVLVTQSYYRTNSNSQGASAVDIKLFRGATDLGLIAVYMGYGATTACVDIGVAAFQTLDTPSTTSPVAYKTQFRNVVTPGSVRVQNNDSPSTITLMEIAA